MRYQVRFDERQNSWIVIDTRVGGKILQRHDTVHDAKHGAWDEEERWYKCSDEGRADMFAGMH